MFSHKESAPGRKLVHVGHDSESNEKGPVQEDKVDSNPETADAEPSSENVIESVEVQREVNA